MAEKSIEIIEISHSPPSSSGQPVVCLKNKDEIRKVEEKEDCFILEFDPDDEFNLSNLSISDHSDADMQLLAQKGKIACRDFPHPRHSCAKFPFKATPHESHCEQCYCYVCDLPAPCKMWAGGLTSHCHAFNNESWTAIRKSVRQGNGLHMQVASKRHWRHECDKFPYGTTSYRNRCELCDCYFCKVPAPCQKWAGHCHAFRSRTVFSRCRQAELLNQNAKVYVGNLPRNIDSKQLAEFFEKSVGVVKASKVVYYGETHKSRGFAFVTLSSVEEAEKAISLNGGYLGNRSITISKAIPSSRSPPGVIYTNKIYVGNLSWTLNVKLLEETFQEHGDVVGYKVVRAEIICDEMTGRSRGFAYVTVISCEFGMEDIIITELSEHVLEGRAIRVSLAYDD